MTRENYIKALIEKKNLSIKEFAKSIDMPYTTLLGMLNNGMGGAAVDNVIKVCKGLEITVDDLQRVCDSSDTDEPFYLTKTEIEIIRKYRAMPEMHPAINAILCINENLD